jgi:hypothetical protein
VDGEVAGVGLMGVVGSVDVDSWSSWRWWRRRLVLVEMTSGLGHDDGDEVVDGGDGDGDGEGGSDRSWWMATEAMMIGWTGLVRLPNF